MQSIVSPALREVAEYWNDVRGDRSAPAWNDIKPAAIKEHLSIVWSYTYDRRSDRFFSRLAGARIVEVFPKIAKGVPMEDAYSAEAYPSVFARNKRVVSGPYLFRGHGLIYVSIDRYGRGERIPDAAGE